jgi:hypothetical protein
MRGLEGRLGLVAGLAARRSSMDGTIGLIIRTFSIDRPVDASHLVIDGARWPDIEGTKERSSCEFL